MTAAFTAVFAGSSTLGHAVHTKPDPAYTAIASRPML